MKIRKIGYSFLEFDVHYQLDRHHNVICCVPSQTPRDFFSNVSVGICIFHVIAYSKDLGGESNKTKNGTTENQKTHIGNHRVNRQLLFPKITWVP